MRKAAALFVAVAAVVAFINWTVYVRASKPLYLTVPAYGASLVEQQPTADDDTKGRLDRLEAKLDKILKLLEDIEAETRPTTAPGQPPAALVSAATKCSTCHSAAVADKSGDGFVLFDAEGKFTRLAERDRKRLVALVTSGKMPPPDRGRLTEAERQALLAVFDPKK